jgi:hypothetical protein
MLVLLLQRKVALRLLLQAISKSKLLFRVESDFENFFTHLLGTVGDSFSKEIPDSIVLWR